MKALELGIRSLLVATGDLLWDRLAVRDGCWEWQGGRDNRGYGNVKRRGTYWKVHRLAYSLAVGPIPSDLIVMHKCDNPPCCNPDHLRLGTVADNNRDRHSKGRTVMPYRTPRASRPHGTRSRYRSGCRCDPCRESENSRQRQKTADARAARGQQPFIRPADRPHGTVPRYRSGCRCGSCREAQSQYARKGRELRGAR